LAIVEVYIIGGALSNSCVVAKVGARARPSFRQWLGRLRLPALYLPPGRSGYLAYVPWVSYVIIELEYFSGLSFERVLMTNQTIVMTDALYDYMLNVSLREHEVLQDLRFRTAKMSAGGMQIAPEQGQFMAMLVTILGARKTLDVGVFTGYSSTVVALALPPEGRVVGFDTNIEWTKMAQQAWKAAGVSDKVELKLGLAADSLRELLQQGEGQSFDFAFIDADKQSYDEYYELCLKLLRVGGVMALDNMFQDGKVLHPETEMEQVKIIHSLNQKIAKDERVNISFLPIADGLMLARKK
jgi:predicted O-methyltransferase YrrM